MANMLATFAQFERRLIGQRTREALAVKKASGVRLGRPPTVPARIVRRIQRQRARGDSLRKIAGNLNGDRVPTAQGRAQCYAATVRGVLGRSSQTRATPSPVRAAGGRGLAARLFDDAVWWQSTFKAPSAERLLRHAGRFGVNGVREIADFYEIPLKVRKSEDLPKRMRWSSARFA